VSTGTRTYYGWLFVSLNLKDDAVRIGIRDEASGWMQRTRPAAVRGEPRVSAMVGWRRRQLRHQVTEGGRTGEWGMYPSLMTEGEWQELSTEYRLTPRELEIIERLCRGAHEDAICRQLGIARPTLKAHRRAAYHKLGVSTRVEMILELVHRLRGGMASEDIPAATVPLYRRDAA